MKAIFVSGTYIHKCLLEQHYLDAKSILIFTYCTQPKYALNTLFSVLLWKIYIIVDANLAPYSCGAVWVKFSEQHGTKKCRFEYDAFFGAF